MIIGAAVADGKVTPKVQSLIKILLKYQHTEDFRAIIFVERVVAALVLPKVGHPACCLVYLQIITLSCSSWWHVIFAIRRSLQSFPLSVSSKVLA